jgi:hypothetical protein
MKVVYDSGEFDGEGSERANFGHFRILQVVMDWRQGFWPSVDPGGSEK